MEDDDGMQYDAEGGTQIELDDMGGMHFVLDQAKKAGKQNFLDRNAFRKMMVTKGFNGPKFLVKDEPSGSPKPAAQGKHFNKLFQDSSKKDLKLKSEMKSKAVKESE